MPTWFQDAGTSLLTSLGCLSDLPPSYKWLDRQSFLPVAGEARPAETSMCPQLLIYPRSYSFHWAQKSKFAGPEGTLSIPKDFELPGHQPCRPGGPLPKGRECQSAEEHHGCGQRGPARSEQVSWGSVQMEAFHSGPLCIF